MDEFRLAKAMRRALDGLEASNISMATIPELWQAEAGLTASDQQQPVTGITNQWQWTGETEDLEGQV